MENLTFLPFLFFGLGVAGRIIIPYMQARLASDEPMSFDWRYLIGQIIAAAVALIPLLQQPEFLADLGAMAWLAALLYGWGAGDIGRAVQKTVS